MTAFMKLKLFLFCFLGLAAGSCTTPFSTSSALAHIQYTFHASVSSISQNGDILFIGLENGDLIAVSYTHLLALARYIPNEITSVIRPLSTCRPENIRDTASPTAIKVK